MGTKGFMCQLTTVDGTPIQQSIYEESSSPKHNLGARATDLYGRVFRYCSNGAVALTAGQMIQSSAALLTKANIAVTTGTGGTLGAKFIEISAVGVTNNQYQGGLLNIINSTLAAAQTKPYVYGIDANTSTAAAACTTGTGYIKVTLDRPLAEAITNGHDCDVTPNPFKSVVVTPATLPTGILIGVPLVNVTASTSSTTYYFWAQTWGSACVQFAGANGDAVAGQGLILASTPAGSLRTITSVAAGYVALTLKPFVGRSHRTLVSVAPLLGFRQVYLTCIP